MSEIMYKSFKDWLTEKGKSGRKLALLLGLNEKHHQQLQHRRIHSQRDHRRGHSPTPTPYTRSAYPVGAYDLRVTLLERLNDAGFGLSETELLKGFRGVERDAALKELERLEMLCEAAELTHGWVRAE